MKKRLCILIVISIMLSVLPPVYAADETDLKDDPPVQIASPQETFTYTQGSNTVKETVGVKVYDLTGQSTPGTTDAQTAPIDDCICRDYEITAETTVNGGSLTKEHNSIVTDGEEIITQAGTQEDKTINTVVDDPGMAIEGENESICTNHIWGEGKVIREASCCRVGIRKYKCTCKNKDNVPCTAVKYEEIPKTAHVRGEKAISKVDCVEDRYFTFQCVNDGCGELFMVSDSSISKGKHNYVGGICTKCGDVVKTQGTVNDGPTYSYENSVLIVNGSGEIPDYKITVPDSEKQQTDIPLTELTPWSSFANKVIEIIIGSGITRIGDFAFANFFNLQQVDIYSKNVTIGDYAFAWDSNLDNVNFLNKEAKPTLENSNSSVTYVDDAAKTINTNGSTAFADSGKVSVNYSCVDRNRAELIATQNYALATVGHTDLHLNCATLPGVAPTETEFGKTEGVYCNDCKKTIVVQNKIYPNGKQETGEYALKALSELTNVPNSLTDAKYNSLKKISELTEKYNTAMAEEFVSTFNTGLKEGNSVIFNVELVKQKTEVVPKTHIVNIPYPAGTTPDTDEFLVVQMNKDEEVEKVDTFLTNKGIQIEIETLMPVGVAWKDK